MVLFWSILLFTVNHTPRTTHPAQQEDRMNPYYTAAFIFTVLLATNRNTWRWLGERWADVRDVMEENEDE